jgi:hypothetical protein
MSLFEVNETDRIVVSRPGLYSQVSFLGQRFLSEASLLGRHTASHDRLCRSWDAFSKARLSRAARPAEGLIISSAEPSGPISKGDFRRKSDREPLQKLDDTVGFADFKERLPFGSSVERPDRLVLRPWRGMAV